MDLINEEEMLESFVDQSVRRCFVEWLARSKSHGTHQTEALRMSDTERREKSINTEDVSAEA